MAVVVSMMFVVGVLPFSYFFLTFPFTPSLPLEHLNVVHMGNRTLFVSPRESATVQTGTLWFFFANKPKS